MSASASANVNMSGSASAPAPMPTNTLGTATLSPVEGATNEAQQKYLAQRELDLQKKREEIFAYDSHPQVSVYNSRDIGLMKDKYADLEAYFNTHRTMKESALDVQLVKRLTPINDIIAAIGPRTVVGWMSETFQTQLDAKAVGAHALTPSETKSLQDYAKGVRAFYVSNPDGTKGAYIKAAVKYLNAYKALGPAFAAEIDSVVNWAIAIDVKHALASSKAGVSAESVEVPKSLTEEVLTTFLKVFLGALFLGFFLSCGMWAANDAIWRAPAYRILYFLYGSVGFIVTFPYYIYRYFTNPVKRFALLPLFELPPDYEYTGLFDRLLKLPFHYIPNLELEALWKDDWRNGQECAIGNGGGGSAPSNSPAPSPAAPSNSPAPSPAAPSNSPAPPPSAPSNNSAPSPAAPSNSPASPPTAVPSVISTMPPK